MTGHRQKQPDGGANKRISYKIVFGFIISLSFVPVMSYISGIWYSAPVSISNNTEKRFHWEKGLFDGVVKTNTTAVQYTNTGKNSVWETELVIGSNKDTINASTPEEILQAFCNGVRTNYKHKMPWTSAEFSKVYLKTEVSNESNSIKISIDSFDKQNRRKFTGYDLIVIWSEQDNGDGRASGNVVNLKNGTYLGIVNVFWTGKTSIYVKIVSPIQNTCIRLNAVKKYGTMTYTMKHVVLIWAKFEKESIVENSRCNPSSFIFGSNRLCNFTSLNDGMTWFCGHPKTKYLTCSDFQTFYQASSTFKGVRLKEKIMDPGHSVFKHHVTLKVKSPVKSDRTVTTTCNARNPSESWTEPLPTGFWLNGKWNFVHCHCTLKHTVNEYRNCLRNKTIIGLGDSTVRQYASYFKENVFRLFSPINDTIQNDTFHRYKIYRNYGINLMFFKHEMPLHIRKLTSKGIVSIPGILDSLRQNKDVMNTSVILLVGYYTHLSSYSPEIFRDRIRRLAAAIQRFLKAHPLTKVFFKGPHLTILDNKWFDSRIGRLYKLILEEEFTDILQQVTYLNTWDITVAHNSEDLHPQGNVLKSQIHQLMAYLC